MGRLLLLTLCSLLVGCSIPAVRDDGAVCVGGPEHTVFVVNHGWHTGLALSYPEARPYLPMIGDTFAGSSYLEIGWGDEGFYRSKEITIGLTLKAIFWPTDSVLHLVEVPIQPQNYFPESEVKRVRLGQPGFTRLMSYIQASFKVDAEGRAIELSEGNYGRRSRFYRAKGTYYLFNTCNSWTERALESGGMEASITPTLTASGVMSQIHSGMLLAGDCNAVVAARNPAQ